MNLLTGCAGDVARPNILFILADQLRPDFLGSGGGRSISTPHLDKLASESVNFHKAISACPLCIPARAALLTGLSSLRTGVISNKYWIRPDRKEAGLLTWPELLSNAGYYTSAIGKMHFTPWDGMEGFHSRVIAEDKRWPLIEDDYSVFLARNGAGKRFLADDPEYRENHGAVVNTLPTDLTVDRFTTGAALEALRNRPKDRPFAFMVGYPSPHCPYDPPREYLDQVDASLIPEPIEDDWRDPAKRALYRSFLDEMREAWHAIDYSDFSLDARRKVRKHYAALVKQLDDEIGSLMEGLAGEGLLENTVIVFASDHGDFVGDRGLVGKKMFYENSVRIPLFVRRPGGRGAGINNDLVELGDVTATLLSLCGIPTPEWMSSRPLPGLGLNVLSRFFITGFLEGRAMVRQGPWKLTRYHCGLKELFNLDADPHELENRITDPVLRPVVDDLLDVLWRDVFESTAFASRTLAFETPEGRYLDPEFCRRGWERRYPGAAGKDTDPHNLFNA